MQVHLYLTDYYLFSSLCRIIILRADAQRLKMRKTISRLVSVAKQLKTFSSFKTDSIPVTYNRMQRLTDVFLPQ